MIRSRSARSLPRRGGTPCLSTSKWVRFPANATSSIVARAATAAKASTTKKSSPRPASAGPTASCYHLRPPTRVRKVEAAGQSPSRSSSRTVLRHHHLRVRRDAASRRRRHRPGAAADQRRRDRSAAAGPAKPQAELYRNAAADEVIFVHKGRGHAAHHVRRRCRSGRSITSSSRIARPIASTSTPKRSRPAGDRGGRQRRRSRRAISIPTASCAWAPLTASATCTARRDRSSSTARRT